LRKFAILAFVLSFLGLATFATAQQADVALGFGTLLSSASNTTSLSNPTISEKGGLYPSLSADVIFHRRIGFEYDISWRGSQGIYGGCLDCQPYRPIISAFNADFQPRLGKKIGVDLLGGIGWQSTRFYGYQPTSNCVYFGACYNSDNHFLVHVGGGLRYYFWHHVFVRPEFHYYRINNNVAFSSDNVVRVSGSIGYTIGPE
jgi:opacity protein-like surface antigen